MPGLKKLTELEFGIKIQSGAHSSVSGRARAFDVFRPSAHQYSGSTCDRSRTLGLPWLYIACTRRSGSKPCGKRRKPSWQGKRKARLPSIQAGEAAIHIEIQPLGQTVKRESPMETMLCQRSERKRRGKRAPRPVKSLLVIGGRYRMDLRVCLWLYPLYYTCSVKCSMWIWLYFILPFT
jgi:hypothetical protein